MPLLTNYLRRRRYAMATPFLRGDVLDIGCGNAATALPLHRVRRYVGVDLNPALVARQRQRFPQHEFRVCDVDREPLPVDGLRFDTVLIMAVIEHLANPGRLLDQVAGHLRSEGRLVITTPTPWGERIHRVGARLGLFHPHAAAEHKHAYDRQRLEALLAAHGYAVVYYQSFELGGNQLVVGRRMGCQRMGKRISGSDYREKGEHVHVSSQFEKNRRCDRARLPGVDDHQCQYGCQDSTQ